jgi:hypothetical protein
MKLKKIFAAVAATTTISAFASGSINSQHKIDYSNVNVKSDAEYSQKILNNQKITNTTLDILKLRQHEKISSNSIYVGGKGEIYGDYSIYNKKSDGASGGSIVSDDNSTKKENNKAYKSSSNTNIDMPYADISVTSTIGDWVTGFADVKVSNIALNNVTLPSAYFVVGDLNNCPVYFVGGKKAVDFGRFNNPSNFTPTLTSAYFMAYGGQAAIGVSDNGMNLAVTLMNGLGNSMLNSGASNISQVNDFAVSASYENVFENIHYYLGGGYINATGFSHNKNSGSDTSKSKNNMVGAVDLNAGITFGDLNLNGEFLMTTQGVDGVNATSVYQNAYNDTLNNTSGILSDSSGFRSLGLDSLPAFLSFSSGSSVKSWSLDASYETSVSDKKMVPYVAYSHVSQNSHNNIYQFEIGTRYNLIDSVWVGSSYNYVSGKSGDMDIGKFNKISLDATAYF